MIPPRRIAIVSLHGFKIDQIILDKRNRRLVIVYRLSRSHRILSIRTYALCIVLIIQAIGLVIKWILVLVMVAPRLHLVLELSQIVVGFATYQRNLYRRNIIVKLRQDSGVIIRVSRSEIVLVDGKTL